MDLRQLRYFVAIVEQGSFSKAAATLNVAQPALSLHVRNMEADLGTALLFRSPQGVMATEAGEILLRNARIIIDQFSIAQEEIRGHEAEPTGEVRLGLPGTISQILSVPLIIAARKRYPKIKLRIAEAMSGFITEWIRESRVDVAVLYIPVEDRVLTSYPVLTEELCLLGPVTAMEDVKTPAFGQVTLKQVAPLPLILPSSSHGLRELLEREASAGKLDLNTVIDVDSYGNIKELVEKGMGYSILPFNAIAREVRDGRLRSWRISKPELKRDVHLVHLADRPMTNAVSAIESLCRDTLLELAATGQWSGAKALR
ncbi:LysR substrate-binding domain-containing protein [Shinella curvata]|uniref:LysR substrate-binding domain-containing protein n=1 Tax=Shinella curvata TaxID=1817964 RepID=A0ABT8XIK5_9HYPH|nr:LysR substrate-binding domain-containing protein [Shinella curvata]MCJ8056111.1 LysR substrate-binding domain-containing protein [Shinella curvata]MDO6123288.1 LysR substrate-binding domain-containing protein [Shinella curvata]